MTKKSNYKRIQISNILTSLPVQRHINESQKAVISFTSTWQEWLNTNLPAELSKKISLNSFENGKLSILCNNSTTASQLKHLQISLLEALHKAGHNQISQIKFDINHQFDETLVLSQALDSKQNHISQKPRKTMTDKNLKNLKHCGDGVKNERLNSALKKLHTTLTKLKEPK